MDIGLPATPESLAHGYLFVGPRTQLEAAVRGHLDTVLPTWADTDGLFVSADTLYIEQARDVALRAQRRAVADRRFFVLSFSGATHEAQNALLKVFEEPPAGTHVFLIVPTPETVLPTLRSRLMTYHMHADEAAFDDAIAFIAANQKERQAIIAPIIEEKDKGRAGELLEGIEAALYRAYRKGVVSSAVLADIETVRGYIADRSASVKMLLEYASAAVPQLKL